MYAPDPLPLAAEDLTEYLGRELDRISATFSAQEVDALQFQVRYVAPDKPRVGLVVYADGTSFNPGSGEGLYLYTSSGYVKL